MSSPDRVRDLQRLVAVLAAFVFLVSCSGTSESPASLSGLSSANVPEGLRELLPLAERWGIGDDVDRSDAIEEASPEELAELRAAVYEHGAAITEWLDSFGSGAAMSEEAAAFMYMQLAVEEMP